MSFALGNSRKPPPRHGIRAPFPRQPLQLHLSPLPSSFHLWSVRPIPFHIYTSLLSHPRNCTRLSGGREARGGDEVRGVYFFNIQQRCHQRPDDHRHPLPRIGTIGMAHAEQGSPRPTCDGRRCARAARVGEHVR